MGSTTNSASCDTASMSETSSSLSPAPSDYAMDLERPAASADSRGSETEDVGPGRRRLERKDRFTQVEAARPQQSKPFSSGKSWSEKEDELLCRLGDDKMPFKLISERLPGRSEDACKARYCDVLAWTREEWTESEEETLIEMCRSGASYHQVADRIPGRSATQCRYRWEHHKAVAKQKLSKQDYAVFLSRGGHNRTRDAKPNFKAHNRRVLQGREKGKTWTSREKKTLMSHRAKGRTWPEVSKHLPGRTRKACEQHYYRLQDSTASRPDQRTIKRAKRLKFVFKPRNQTWLEDEASDVLDQRSPAGEADTLPSHPFEDADTEHPAMDIDDDNDDEPAAGKKDVDRGHQDVIILSSDSDSEPDALTTKAQQNRPWTDLDLNTLTYLRAKGKVWEEISKHFTGRTPAACELRYAWYRHLKNAERRRALISQKPDSRVWRPEDEGVDLLTGAPCEAEVTKTLFTSATKNGDDLATVIMGAMSDSDKSEYYSATSHKPTPNNSSILATDTEHARQNPTSASTEDAISSAGFARLILYRHRHLVELGEGKVRQSTHWQHPHLQRAKRFTTPNRSPTKQQESVTARYEALKQLRRTHPPRGRRGDDASSSSPSHRIQHMRSENPTTSKTPKDTAGIGASSSQTPQPPSPHHPPFSPLPPTPSTQQPPNPPIPLPFKTQTQTQNRNPSHTPHPIPNSTFDPELPTSHHAREEPNTNSSSASMEAIGAEDDALLLDEEGSESEDVKGFFERWGIR